MGKSKHKSGNWKQYNQALVQCSSLTVWMDEQAIKQWHCQTRHGPVTHLVIDATGLKIYSEGEWKSRKHGKEKRRV